ncbi:Kynurenine 3-monooxygenase [Galdieria sulphuraria]|nr:Kynurenine 3-monooxygenase [Galdieria sulphuraria]
MNSADSRASIEELHSSSKRIVVVGGGLAGSLEGLFLAKRLGSSYEIRIYEKREDPRLHEGLSEEVSSQGVPMYGRGIHHSNGQFEIQPYGLSKKGEFLTSISRHVLNCILLNACERAGVNLCFKKACSSIDLANNILYFEESESLALNSSFESTEQDIPWEFDNVSSKFIESEIQRTSDVSFNVNMVKADVIVGADGVFSRVRQILENCTKAKFNYSQVYLPTCYKELTINPTASGSYAMYPNCLHIWPRGRFMLIALPNSDGSFTCTLFMDEDGYAVSFKNIETNEQLLNLFSTYFKDVIPLIPDLLNQYFHSPLSFLLYTQCEPYHFKNNIVLIGDAAHAIVPFYGQGCNLAFEDCRILDELIELHCGKWFDVLQHFSQSRKSNADVIARLALENYLEMAQKTSSRLFLLRKRIQITFSEWFPNTFPSLYRLVSFTNVPYRDAVSLVEKGNSALRKYLICSLCVTTLASFYWIKCLWRTN